MWLRLNSARVKEMKQMMMMKQACVKVSLIVTAVARASWVRSVQGFTAFPRLRAPECEKDAS